MFERLKKLIARLEKLSMQARGVADAALADKVAKCFESVQAVRAEIVSNCSVIGDRLRQAEQRLASLEAAISRRAAKPLGRPRKKKAA